MARLKNKLEAVLEHIINENTDKAAKLLHDIVVEKAKGFYQELSEKDDYEMKRVGGRPDDDFTDDIRADMDEIESDEIYDAREISEAAKLLKRIDSGKYSVHLVQENGSYKLLLSNKGAKTVLDEKAFKERSKAISAIKALEAGRANVKDVFQITEARGNAGMPTKQDARKHLGKDAGQAAINEWVEVAKRTYKECQEEGTAASACNAIAVRAANVEVKPSVKLGENKRKVRNESYEKYYKGDKEVDTNGEYEVGDDEYYGEDIGAEYYHGKKSVKHDGDQIGFGDDHYDEGEDYSGEYEIEERGKKKYYEQEDDEMDMDAEFEVDDETNGEMDMDMDLENGEEPEEIEDRVADLESELEMLRQEFEEIVGKEIGDEDEADYEDEIGADDEGYEDEADMGEGDYDLDEDFELEVIEDVEEGLYPEKAEQYAKRDNGADNVKSIQNQAPRENRGAKPVEFTKGSDGQGRPAPGTKDNTPSNNADYKVKDQKGLDKNEDKTDKSAGSTISGKMRAGE